MICKIVIPRLLATLRYILSELEEREREDTFRMKRVQQMKLRNKAAKVKRVISDEKVCSRKRPKHICEACQRGLSGQKGQRTPEMPCIKDTKSITSARPCRTPSPAVTPKKVQHTCSLHQLEQETEGEFGFFENKYKEITRITRLQNKDGTVSEEKQVITVRTERRNPRKYVIKEYNSDSCIPRGFGAGEGRGRKGGYSGSGSNYGGSSACCTESSSRYDVSCGGGIADRCRSNSKYTGNSTEMCDCATQISCESLKSRQTKDACSSPNICYTCSPKQSSCNKSSSAYLCCPQGTGGGNLTITKSVKSCPLYRNVDQQSSVCCTSNLPKPSVRNNYHSCCSLGTDEATRNLKIMLDIKEKPSEFCTVKIIPRNAMKNQNKVTKIQINPACEDTLLEVIKKMYLPSLNNNKNINKTSKCKSCDNTKHLQELLTQKSRSSSDVDICKTCQTAPPTNMRCPNSTKKSDDTLTCCPSEEFSSSTVYDMFEESEKCCIAHASMRSTPKTASIRTMTTNHSYPGGSKHSKSNSCCQYVSLPSLSSKRKMIDACTATKASSRFDVRPASWRRGAAAKPRCLCQSDTAVIKCGTRTLPRSKSLDNEACGGYFRW